MSALQQNIFFCTLGSRMQLVVPSFVFQSVAKFCAEIRNPCLVLLSPESFMF